MRLSEHLLILRYWKSQQEAYFRGWALEISSFRLQSQAILQDSPSRRNYLGKNFLSAYGKSRKPFLKVNKLNSKEMSDRA